MWKIIYITVKEKWLVNIQQCCVCTIPSFPGPAQLSISCSMETLLLLFCTASDGNMGGAWEEAISTVLTVCENNTLQRFGDCNT